MDNLTKEILSYHFYRQSVDLKNDYKTPGTVNKDIWNHLKLPLSMKEKSFLDIGANDGLFSFEAESKGAKKVTASDLYKEGIDSMKNGWDKKGITLLKNYFKSSIELHEKGIYNLSELNHEYDIVLLAYVINWLDNIELAFEEIAKVTKGSLYIADGFMTENNFSKKFEIKNMPMRNMYNLKFLENILAKKGFKIELISKLNNQKIFVQNFIKFPKINSIDKVKIYDFPDLKSQFKISMKEINTICNSVQNHFYHIAEIGWVYHDDVKVTYFKPSILYKICKTLKIEFLYYSIINHLHEKRNGYCYYLIKASKL